MLREELRREGRPCRTRLAVQFARSMGEVLEAQRLRYRVFGEEMGARLSSPEPGVDRDIFDPFCEHLLVRDTGSGEVVGTYRILNGAQAKKLGGFYSDDEFDLVRLDHLRERLVEVGRSCVHPDYRGGAAIAMLWAGLAEYMRRHSHEYLIGCASVSMRDGGRLAASLYRRLAPAHLSPAEYRVFPRHRLPLEALEGDLESPLLPPLLKGYLRLGAWICGEPAWDPDFNTADLLILLPLSGVNPRYARHFLRGA
ncbi:MAG TPA: GNAT family N-acyltransferase [Burkholderiales bacterium]